MRVIGHEVKPLCIGNNEVINVYEFGEPRMCPLATMRLKLQPTDLLQEISPPLSANIQCSAVPKR